MTLIAPLPEIQSFTWQQRMVRGWFALIETLFERLIHRTPDHISVCFIFLGMSLMASPFLLGAATMIHMVATTRTNGWMILALKETRMSTTPQTGVGVIQEVCREIFSCSHPRRLAVRPDGRVVFLKIAPCSW